VVTALLAAAVLQSGCVATPVHYEPSKFPGQSDTPWVVGTPVAPGLLGALVNYPGSLRDPRVNRSDGLVLRRVGAKIAWNQPGTLRARRLDRPGSFRTDPSSTMRFPSTGCWRLTLWDNTGSGSPIASVIARVVSVPKRLGCGITVLEHGSAFARPRSSGIRGGWPWYSTARLATHGHDGDANMKIPWWVRRNWGPTLELAGRRLDGDGSFRQEFPAAYGHDGAQDQMVFPSIVDIPAAGCWLLRLRTGRLAGVLVVRAFNGRG
jgi:hypothetical protein